MKFGILCNGTVLQHWQFESVSLLTGAGHTCAFLVVNANPAQQMSFRDKIFHYPYSNFLCRAWFRFMIRPAAKNNTNINDLLPGIPQIKCITTKRGISEYFDFQDIEKIKSYNPDFLLRFGFGIIKGEILESARYGVWSYHHDDDRKYRGVPTGFWEIMFGDPVNAAILQRLTSKIDSGVILHKAYFKTINHSWKANLNNLLQSSVEWPLQVCRKIESGNTEFLSVTNAPSSAIYKLPGNGKMLYFLLIVALNKLRFHYRDLFKSEKWNVGIIPLPFGKLIQPGENTIQEPVWLKISTQKSEYHADPFGIEIDDFYHILCEEYDYKNAKGTITSLQIDRHTHQVIRKTTALERNYHLAFPYLFEYDNNYFCVPENSEGGNLDMYRYNPADGKLIFEQTLVKNLQAIDPTLFFNNGHWWLFFTDKVSTNERLHIWYSENLNGPYTPHTNNPVKVNIRSARPAGKPFLLDGKLLRPAQDCSIRSGRRITLNEIQKLTADEFVEMEYAILNPAPDSEYNAGMHTFCVTNGAVIVDGKSECFIWQAFIRKISGKFNRFVKRIK